MQINFKMFFIILVDDKMCSCGRYLNKNTINSNQIQVILTAIFILKYIFSDFIFIYFSAHNFLYCVALSNIYLLEK